MQQPQGFVDPVYPHHICKLHKAIYGLRQAPRAWYSQIDSYMLKQNFYKSETEATLYVRKSTDKVQLIVSLYVDDLFVTGGDEFVVNKFKIDMANEFEMLDLGLMHYFLGLQIYQEDERIFLSKKSMLWKS